MDYKRYLEYNYPDLVNQMKLSSHHHSNGSKSPHHMEGSIWDHTMLVYQRALLLNNKLLELAALLHDIGKMDTRKEKDNGRVAFRYHENVSMYKSIDILKKLELSDEDILYVLRMIAWHGMLWRKKHERHEDLLSKINRRYSFDGNFYQDFVKFVKADAFGRILANDSEETRLLEEFHFLENYIPFNANQYSIHNPKQEVVCLIGISGSGKSTYISKNKALQDYKILSVDKYLERKKLAYNSLNYEKEIKKAHDQSLRDMKEYVSNENNVVIDMTNLSVEKRSQKLSKFPTTKYKKRAIVFLNGIKGIESNLSKRKDKTIPKEVIKKQLESFELPTLEEFHEIEFIF